MVHKHQKHYPQRLSWGDGVPHLGVVTYKFGGARGVASAKMGDQGPPGEKKSFFFKNAPGPHGMPKQVFLARFELVLALLKSQNALKMGCFRTKNGSQIGQRFVFPKNDPRPFGVRKQVKGAHFEPIASHLAPSKVTKCFENGLFWDQKSVNNRSQMCFSKTLLDHLGCTNKWNGPIVSPI